MRYTWDGLRTFTKIETAATHALDSNVKPEQLQILSEGKLTPVSRWEVDDLLMHMRDQAPPC